MEIPLKPFPAGKVSNRFGGPAKSRKEVLERTRIALSPRGSWSHRGAYRATHEGYARCLTQTINDVDGHYSTGAKSILLIAIREKAPEYRSIEGFNDSIATHKYHVIEALDRAIEIASHS